MVFPVRGALFCAGHTELLRNEVLIAYGLWSEKVHLNTLSLSSAKSHGHGSFALADLLEPRKHQLLLLQEGAHRDVPLSIPACKACGQRTMQIMPQIFKCASRDSHGVIPYSTPAPCDLQLWARRLKPVVAGVPPGQEMTLA